MKYLAKLNSEQSEIKYTMTHVAGLAIAHGLHKIRRDVGTIVFGYFKHSKRLGTTVLVDVEGGKDLVPVTLWDAHKMTIKEFAETINNKIKRAKSKKDTTHNKMTLMANILPAFVA